MSGYITNQAFSIYRALCFLNWDSMVLDWHSWFSTRWVTGLTITTCSKTTECIEMNFISYEMKPNQKPVIAKRISISTSISLVQSTFSILVLSPLGYKSSVYPFKPQYPHTTSPNWSLYISFMDGLREFDKRWKRCLLGDHFVNSHNLISWHCMDIVRRKLMLVTIGT